MDYWHAEGAKGFRFLWVVVLISFPDRGRSLVDLFRFLSGLRSPMLLVVVAVVEMVLRLLMMKVVMTLE